MDLPPFFPFVDLNDALTTGQAVEDLTCALIGRASVTPNDAGCQALIAQRLQQVGMTCEYVNHGRVHNLWASHGQGHPVLVLLGHTDVVPPGPVDAWQSDPFLATKTEHWLYGRGAADMKSSVAAFVVAMEQFLANDRAHRGTLVLLVTSDEEGPAIDGVRYVAQQLAARHQTIDWCITGEPTSQETLGDQIRIGRRGSLSATVRIEGIQGHVAYPELAQNPVHAAAPAIAALVNHCWDQGIHEFPPTQLQISNIKAGTGAGNMIPGQLEMQLNVRYNPLWDAQNLQNAIQDLFHRHGLTPTFHWQHSGAPFYTGDGRLREVACEVITRLTGQKPQANPGGGTSDARFIAPLGAQCIEIGPVNASIHQANERIALADLHRLPWIYREMITQLLC